MRASAASRSAGAVIVYNGSVLHGHRNEPDHPRRSIQGAHIRRGAKTGTDFGARMRPDTLRCIGPLAQDLVAAKAIMRLS